MAFASRCFIRRRRNTMHRPRKTNDMSCVLKVTASGHSVLLTSDIEAWSEERLLARSSGGTEKRRDAGAAPRQPDFVDA